VAFGGGPVEPVWRTVAQGADRRKKDLAGGNCLGTLRQCEGGLPSWLSDLRAMRALARVIQDFHPLSRTWAPK